MSDLSLDVSELKDLARDLKRINPELAKEFLKALGKSGDVVALKAKTNAGFSGRIPGSVKVRRRGVAVRVQAGGDAAPGAAPLEHGGKTGTFRHPVFGNTAVWVNQAAHPFLTPAVEATTTPLAAAIVAGVDVAFAKAGFH